MYQSLALGVMAMVIAEAAVRAQFVFYMASHAVPPELRGVDPGQGRSPYHVDDDGGGSSTPF